MSYRPTISVYINGEIVDFGYYKNWDDRDLFYEALATAALFCECKSKQEYNQKRYGRQTIYYDLSPEYWENTGENLKELECCSECPILVDLTEKCIYISTGAKTHEELMRLPNGLEDQKTDRVQYDSRIPFDQIDLNVLLEQFQKEEELQRHLSREVIRLLQDRSFD